MRLESSLFGQAVVCGYTWVNRFSTLLGANMLTQNPQQIPAKKWWAVSKTLWFKFGVTALGVAWAVFPVADSVLPFAKPFMTPEAFALATAGIGGGHWALPPMTHPQLASKAAADTGLNDDRHEPNLFEPKPFEPNRYD